MNTKVPTSVDEVFAAAARMSREQRGATASPLPDNAALDLSLAAVAHHARNETNAAGRAGGTGPGAAATATDSPPAPQAAYRSPTLFVEPVAAPEQPPTPAAASLAGTVFTADIACQSEVIAALHENAVQDGLGRAQVGAAGAVADKLGAVAAQGRRVAASALRAMRQAALWARAELGSAVRAVRMVHLPKLHVPTLSGVPRLRGFSGLARLARLQALHPWAAMRWQAGAGALSRQAALVGARGAQASGAVRAHPRGAAAAAVVLGAGLLLGLGHLLRGGADSRKPPLPPQR